MSKTPKLIKKIAGFIPVWADVLGLAEWKFICVPQKERINCMNEGIEYDMACSPAWRYLEARIFVNVYQCKLLNDDELEACVLHELLHCVLSETEMCDVKSEEHVVSLLVNAFMRRVNGG